MKTILCQSCENNRPRHLKGRDICVSCYAKEPSAPCKKCGLLKHQLSEEAGLCLTCLGVSNPEQAKNSKIREIICEVCQHFRRTPHSRDICRTCYLKEEVNRCSQCHKLKHQVSTETGLCLTCTKALSRPEASCKRCSKVRVIRNQEEWLCKNCHDYIYSNTPARLKRSKVKVTCTTCNRLKASVFVKRDICDSCYRKELCFGICVGCKKEKTIVSRTKQLCTQCSSDEAAPRRLASYIEKFTTPYRYNKTLFDLLVSNIDRSSVKYEVVTRFRVFGRFLTSTELPEPLTWEAIDRFLPEIQSTNKQNSLVVRSCLYDLGYLLADKNSIENRNSYIDRRRIIAKISQAPEKIRLTLYRYFTWQEEHKIKPRSMYNRAEILAKFWSWLEKMNVLMPEQVQPQHYENYLKTLYWRWQCSECMSISEISFQTNPESEHCSHCGLSGCLLMVRKYKQKTICYHHSAIFVFFKWAKANRLITHNPVRQHVKTPDPKISHYSFEVIRQLCQYIVNPKSDPTESLILYLVIFHALSPWELRNVTIPKLQICINGNTPSLANTYYLRLPKLEPSRGVYSPGRPYLKLDFHPAASRWLKPLLTRFEEQRQQALKNPQNNYLLVAPERSRHNCPVSNKFALSIIQKASIHAIGGVCTTKALRITAAVMLIDKADGGILTHMGWSAESAMFYSWGPRELIHPKTTKSPSEQV